MSSAGPRRPSSVDTETPPVLVLSGPVSPAGTPRRCAELRALLAAARTGVVVCEVAGLGPPGLAAVDLLARLELTARRAGGRIRLRGAGPALRGLLDLVGLRFETERQAEQREPPGGVQEAVETGDPPG
ncbi:STAS domain-containing protein [Streptomyces sp. SID8352]|uniref:STAS domain-containing protein n=1 Tax=Streptomyces sp. SID8352 TaxID=2690338 RepID=UPI00136FE6C2|nr:STAS domain-containing protein [Streptomyces sp. SID8352]MYU25747.1 STAS domain-containing protein [Streptomyces sp. SID8352]